MRLQHCFPPVLILLPVCLHRSRSRTACAKAGSLAEKRRSVLVFAGTGWYRHPEVAAISGWLARLADDTGMQIDVTENPKDLLSVLDRYDVLVLNNCTELSAVLDERARDRVRDWYQAGGGSSPYTRLWYVRRSGSGSMGSPVVISIATRSFWKHAWWLTRPQKNIPPCVVTARVSCTRPIGPTTIGR